MIDHWPRFTHFVKAETACGGPDCQLHLLLSLAPEPYTVQDRVWLAGCYAAHHCVPSAYAIFREWTPQGVVEHFSAFTTWIADRWNALPVRPEMRSHRMLEKRVVCLRDFAFYTLEQSWMEGGYDELWDDSQAKVKYYGRYMAIKYLELLRRIARPDVKLMDVRAENAWSPRITLGMLYPEHADIIADRNNNSDEAIELAEQCAADAIWDLKSREVDISFFQLQVLLCNYREMLDGGFYPGAGHDEEMDYISKAQDKFELSYIYDIRKRVFDHRYLGELNGWHGLRRSEFLRWKNHPDFSTSVSSV